MPSRRLPSGGCCCRGAWRPASTGAALFHVNVAVHAVAWVFAWSVLLAEGDYARAIGYVITIAALRVPVALAFAHWGHTVANSARLALVCVTCGNIVAGVLMCLAARGLAPDGVIPIVLVTLNQLDPMALLVVHVASAVADGDGGGGGGGGDENVHANAARARDAVHAAAQSARVAGTLLGAFLFTGTWVEAASNGALFAAGLVLIGAQLPLLPIHDTAGAATPPPPGGGECCAAAQRIAAHALRETDRTTRSIANLHLAIAVDVAVSLALSISVATWSYQALALWDTVYGSDSATAWGANSASAVVLAAAAFLARTRVVSIDAHTPSHDTVAAGAAMRPVTQWGQEAAAAEAEMEAPWRKPAPRLRQGGLDADCASRLRLRLAVYGTLLLAALACATVLDLSLRTETPVHALVSLVVACGAIQVDQLAVQTAALSNAHVRGTHVDVQLFYLLGGARATVYALGFVIGWFWRERLRVSAIYALPFAAAAYAHTLVPREAV